MLIVLPLTVTVQGAASDADAHPSDRLANLVAQRRARWLLSRIDELFLEETPEKSQ